MSLTPPSLPVAQFARSESSRKWKRFLGVLAIAGIVLLVCFYFLFRHVISTGVTRGLDNQFGDQHLKTAVALIELHKVRHGRYPASLRDIRFRGGWDQLALNSVDYYPNPEGTAYYLEVNQGWVAKPDLQMPPEFWQGTGYSPKLKPPPK